MAQALSPLTEYGHCYFFVGQVPYLPMYNAHPDFEASFQKKQVSMLFLTATNFLEKDSNNLKSSSTSMKFNYKT